MSRTVCVFVLAIFALSAFLLADDRKGVPDFIEGVGPANTIQVPANKAKVLHTNGTYKRISIAAPDIANIDAVGPNQLLITGKTPGVTNMTIWDDKDHAQTVDIEVTPSLRIPGGKSSTTAPAGTEIRGGSGRDGAGWGSWELADDPISADALPGFVQLNFKDRKAHMAAHSIAAIIVEKSATRIVFSVSSDAALPPCIVVPAAMTPPEKILELVRNAGK